LELQIEYGESDPGNVIRLWNGMASKAHQLNAAKAQAVKNILGMPLQPRTQLMDAVQDDGWEACPWTDDVLASKKIMVGYQPRGASKRWNERQKVSEAGLTLMITHVNSEHRKAPACARKKLLKSDAEDKVLWASSVLHLAKEVQALLPVSDKVMEDMFINKFATADPRVTGEVQMVNTERQEKFTLKDVPTLAEIMDHHRGNTPLHAIGASTMILDNQKVEEASYTLVKNQVEYDFKAWRVFDNKMDSFHGALHMVKMSWKLRVFEDNVKAVMSYLNSYTKFTNFEGKDSGEIERTLFQFKNDIAKHCQISEGNMVHGFTYPPHPLLRRIPTRSWRLHVAVVELRVAVDRDVVVALGSLRWEV